MDLRRLYNNLNNLDVVDIMVASLEELADYIADLNREQLAAGKLSTNNNIIPEYTEITEIIKTQTGVGLGRVIDRVTLYDEGDFHKSIFSEIFSDEIILDATDWKLDDLEKKYSKDILGLTPDNIQKVKNKVLPIFWKKFNEQIHR